MQLGKFILRVTVGGLFVGHGTHKLFGWFGGRGLQGTADAFDAMGMRPGKPNALAAGVAEAGGGAALALGFATPLAASALTATMITAIDRVHLKNGPWATSGGYEYNAVLIATVLALTEAGPGDLSVDHLRGVERSGTLWMLAALGAGVAGAAGARLIADRVSASADTEVPAPFEPQTAAFESASGSVPPTDAEPVVDGENAVDSKAPGSDGAEPIVQADDAPAEDASAE